MQDVYVETEVLTLPLRVAMVASRAAAVLKGVTQGRVLDEKGTCTIRALSEILEKAAQGGTVLLDRSMENYSAEAMSAYRLVQKTKKAKTGKEDTKNVVQWLIQNAKGLRELADKKQTNLQLENLQLFLVFLTKRSLNESAGRQDVLQMG
jgi:hypothetical protein